MESDGGWGMEVEGVGIAWSDKSFLPILKTDTLLRSTIFKKSNFEKKQKKNIKFGRMWNDCGRGASALEHLFIKKSAEDSTMYVFFWKFAQSFLLKQDI